MDSEIEIKQVIKDYEGVPLKGPNSMVLSASSNTLYFSDSGPLGETSLESPHGSIFAVDLPTNNLKAVIFNKLAYPSGLALSNDEGFLFVSETNMNRVLRIVIHSTGVYHSTVFHQFEGRLGPTALAMPLQRQLICSKV